MKFCWCLVFLAFDEFCIQLVLFEKTEGIFTLIKRLFVSLMKVINVAAGFAINVSWYVTLMAYASSNCHSVSISVIDSNFAGAPFSSTSEFGIIVKLLAYSIAIFVKLFFSNLLTFINITGNEINKNVRVLELAKPILWGILTMAVY